MPPRRDHVPQGQASVRPPRAGAVYFRPGGDLLLSLQVATNRERSAQGGKSASTLKIGLEVAMVKDRCSAEQLADMITQKINVTGVKVAVRRDHAYGWVQRDPPSGGLFVCGAE
jgi:hypothetical protein